ncbi:MAG: restriction endonuclease subunit M/S [Chloroflexota bacterium]|nr:MAG: restriction endonuclease subunit M/S [Chloroflexota bacterium]
MLDTDTKRRIDTARDILVGKVPDPKSQVEQITIALIYKFMDDIDAESEELGGQRKFFADDFARYGWAKLMRSRLGGFETLNLYAEAIGKMPENPGIPPLFRDIFKNAYLPYRDPETLRAFLKIIDEFEYDHSERLGDAFEYLLSVLGSQGDAGQFRTPRHIIDFMVAIIDPKKNERVLDPACGTAGFLISSYKHILKANTDARGNSTLTPDDKGRLAQNFSGYDISPDMVRLSQVNLYLHGFIAPHIAEYDTLTSQEKWNEHADVILANPPFMSPKGGIQPHNRFSVQSKRSEVLFVDYMAEHLTSQGRAGIIVPEGVIFQSQTAHTDLRRMLVENYLVAVVSLPAGVFNPYSGVKTSILILDRSIARQSDTIGFFKIENDGFGLGAQRRAVEKNDLPQARAEIADYLRRLRARESLDGFQPTLGLIVSKAKIAANGEYNLSGERYREISDRPLAFPRMRIGSICAINPPKSEVRELPSDTRVSFVPMADLDQNRMSFKPRAENRISEISASYTFFMNNDVLLAKVTPCFENGKAGIARDLTNGLGFGSSEFYVLRSSESVLSEWLYFCVTHPTFRGSAIAQMTGTGGLQRVPRRFVEDFEIPLPPLEVQQEIVAEIEGYQKVIDGARGVLDNYRPHIPIHPDWPTVDLATVIKDKPKNGYSGKPVDRVTPLKVLTLSATTPGRLDLSKHKYLDEDIPPGAGCRCRKGDIYLQRGNTAELVGTAVLFDVDETNYIYPDLMIRVRADESKVDSRYLLTALQSQPVRDYLMRNAVGAAGSMPKINQSIVERTPIPLAPLATQQAIVAEIEAEQALVNANRELIARFEKKIQATLARVWGEDEPVTAGPS